MSFKPGHPKYGGKKPGSLNQRSKQFLDVLEKTDFCPASAMMDIFKIAMEQFAHEVELQEAGRISPMESNAAKYLKIAADQASGLASYAYPKLKAIEQTKNDQLKDMTPSQKLEAMKQAVRALELQVKKDDGSGVS